LYIVCFSEGWPLLGAGMGHGVLSGPSVIIVISVSRFGFYGVKS
jgi:hypothetical protein